MFNQSYSISKSIAAVERLRDQRLWPNAGLEARFHRASKLSSYQGPPDNDWLWIECIDKLCERLPLFGGRGGGTRLVSILLGAPKCLETALLAFCLHLQPWTSVWSNQFSAGLFIFSSFTSLCFICLFFLMSHCPLFFLKLEPCMNGLKVLCV